MDLSRTVLLGWLNDTLTAKFARVDQLRTGAAYCQLMDLLFPGSVPLRRVKFCTNVPYDCFTNLRLLQGALNKVGAVKAVPVAKLADGNIRAHLDFLRWFKAFFDANAGRAVGQQYDALAARDHQPLAYRNAAAAVLQPSQKGNTPEVPFPVVQKTARAHPNTSAKENRTVDALQEELQFACYCSKVYHSKLEAIRDFVDQEYPPDRDTLCKGIKGILYDSQ